MKEKGFLRKFLNNLAWGQSTSGIPSDTWPLSKLIATLDNKDNTLAEKAAIALGRLSNPEAIPALLKKIRDNDSQPYPRAAAGWALGQIGANQDKTAIQQEIFDTLGTLWSEVEYHGPVFPLVSDLFVQRGVGQGLAAYGNKAVPVLRELMFSEQKTPHSMNNALVGLYYTYAVEAIPIMIELLESPYKGISWFAPSFIGNLAVTLNDTEAQRESVAALMKALKDESPVMRTSTVEALGEMVYSSLLTTDLSDSIVARLIPMLQDSEEAGRPIYLTVAQTLKGISTPAAQDAVKQWALARADLAEDLFGKLRSRHGLDAQNLASELGIIGTFTEDPRLRAQIVDALLDVLLTNPDRFAAMYAVEGLGSIVGHSSDDKLRNRVKPHLLKALAEMIVKVRVAAAEALAELKDRSTVPALVGKTHDESSRVRVAAVYALGQIGDSRAFTALVEALGDDEFPVRQRTASALGWLGDPGGISHLAHLLNEEPVRYQSGPSIPEIAVKALERIGTAEALATIRKWQEDYETEFVPRPPHPGGMAPSLPRIEL